MSTHLKSKLGEYDVIGFDMDQTLAKYKLENLLPWLWNSQMSYLVNNCNYDESLKDIVFNPQSDHWNFLCKGLVYDMKLGTILLLDDTASISQAIRGGHELSPREIDILYPNKRQPDFRDQLVDSYYHGNDHRLFENSFDIVCCSLLNELMRRKERGSLQLDKSPRDIWNDVFSSLQHIYTPGNLESLKPGHFYYDVSTKPSEFFDLVSEDLKNTLKELRSSGKLVFLMTASFQTFADTAMNYIWGGEKDSWKEDFDLVLYSALKPQFFKRDSVFLSAQDSTEVQQLNKGGLYSKGNYQILQKFLVEVTNKADPRVVYFGDSCKSDVFPVSKHTSWEAWSIIEELAIEASPGHTLRGKHTECKTRWSITTEKDVSDEKRAKTDVISLPTDNSELKGLARVASDSVLHKPQPWGSSFYCKDGRKTLWFSLLNKHSSVMLQQLTDLTHD